MELHEKLTKYREQLGLLQKDVAEALHVSPPLISRWEAGLREPKIWGLKVLAKFYGVSLTALLSPDYTHPSLFREVPIDEAAVNHARSYDASRATTDGPPSRPGQHS